MKKVFKFSLKLFLCVIYLTSCKKTEFGTQTYKSNSQLGSNAEKNENYNSVIIDHKILNAVLNDPKFISFMNKIDEIVKVNNATENKLNESQLAEINKELSLIENETEGVFIFNKFAIKNSEKLFRLFSELTPILKDLINTNFVFEKLNKIEINFIFVESIKEFKKNKIFIENNLYGGDKCVIGYTNGMASCDTNFAIGTATSILAGAIAAVGSLGTGAVPAAIAVTAGIGASYASLYVCQEGVVQAWRDCRGYN